MDHRERVTKAERQRWLNRGKMSSQWKGIPVFGGDIFCHKAGHVFYVATFDLLRGVQLVRADTGEADLVWYFELLFRQGTLWSPPKDFSGNALADFHKARGAEARGEEIIL